MGIEVDNIKPQDATVKTENPATEFSDGDKPDALRKQDDVENGETENDDDTGLLQLESLCMNCHKNACLCLLITALANYDRVSLAYSFFASPTSATSCWNPLNALTAFSKTIL